MMTDDYLPRQVREARTTSLSVWSDEGAIGSSVPLLLRPMAAAAVVGSIGIAFPRILFNGYATLNAILANTQPEPPLSLLGYSFLKIGTTAFSLGAGLVGGLFAPSLFIGATAGAAFHSLVASATEFAATNLVSLSSPSMWSLARGGCCPSSTLPPPRRMRSWERRPHSGRSSAAR